MAPASSPRLEQLSVRVRDARDLVDVVVEEAASEGDSVELDRLRAEFARATARARGRAAAAGVRLPGDGSPPRAGRDPQRDPDRVPARAPPRAGAVVTRGLALAALLVLAACEGGDPDPAPDACPAGAHLEDGGAYEPVLVLLGPGDAGADLLNLLP